MKVKVKFHATAQMLATMRQVSPVNYGAALRCLASLRGTAIRQSIVAVVFLALLLPLPLLARQTLRPRGATSPKLAAAAPESVGMSSERLAKVDAVVLEAIARNETPGAVVLVAHNGRIVYRKAFGDRAVEPQREPMSVDTVFDLASLTKVVATATSIMILVEQGKVSLADPVARYIPEFGRFGKERITVEQLMTHRAGLPPDNEIADYVGKTLDPLEQIYDLRPSYEPGTRFVYSDVGFIVAAELVRNVSGESIDTFARKNICEPLGMRDTNFSSLFAGLNKMKTALRGTISLETTDPYRSRPLTEAESKPYRLTADSMEARLKRLAPTEMREGRWMRGEVHDPRAYEMGGVAGHAGLFSTADDLAAFCQMILNKGEYNGTRILAPYTVERMISAHSLPTSEMRGIGWDVNTAFSSNRGDLFPVGTFGHTGFTGTSIWIDPVSETFVVLLTNRVHPNGKGDVTRLRSVVASTVASAITDLQGGAQVDLKSPPRFVDAPRAAITRAVPTGPLHPVLTGIDVLERDDFKQLAGRRVGLITNHTGRDLEGRSTIDVLASAKGLKLVALFAPEHGLRGIEDSSVADQRDQKTGLPVYSLYDKTRRRPTAEMLKDIDTLVFDIQDVGTRFYTYLATCGYAMEEAARNRIKFVVLDRPNPINGYDLEGPVADVELAAQPGYSFTSYHAIPVRYGLTIGELAMLLNTERKIGADLTVIKMEGWRRADYYDATGLEWVNPSPNMRSLTEALLYPGIGLLETTNVSVGRGTDTPFEVIGAPWIDGAKLSEALNRAGLPGARFVPVRFTPRSSSFSGEQCKGVNIVITERGAFKPVAVGFEIAYHIWRLHPREWKIDDYLRLLANNATLAALRQGKTPSEIAGTWQAGLSEFALLRRKYMIY